ncbi:HipA domain-containing protein [Butyrivibrio sp. INlla21]|uniref:HipA domain-containing protein n=1 Tax=Butyrivibrio sp. INlla21 TaxID=1520811 RepID=UPI0008EBBBBD|nr:HipA domain-containing protein [Butyrivibrio sp. INlla21]SFU92342.1 serine/threonine-protein kinase HipA [Butyrivibrio sp. INlla21]
MRNLGVYIEINGEQTLVGNITGEAYTDATFKYDSEFMNASYGAPISISLPFQEESFTAENTRTFFESLLPEGFSRRAVADWIKTDEKDYLSILAGLGRECLGAIKIAEGGVLSDAHYEKLTKAQVKSLAAEGATRSTQILMETHLSLTGASGKVGLYYDPKGKWYLPKGDAPSTHIVKQSHVRLDRIVLNEQLCMLTAKNIGIDVPESFIVNVGGGEDSDVLYATKRYDRDLNGVKEIDGLLVPLRLHQEDFAQAMGIAAEDKYEKQPIGYMKKMFDLIKKHSSNPIEDQSKLLERIIFNFLIGNTDCHLKNYALLYSPDLKSVRLSPAYDIVSTRVYNSIPEMSFYIGGELDINNINRDSFIKSAEDVGLSNRVVETTFDRLSDRFEKSLKEAAESLTNSGFVAAKKLKNDILKTGGYSHLK